MAGFSNDDEFWESSPRLRFIRDTARAARSAPWAVLLATLVRVAVATPPNVVTPGFVGGRPGVLNSFAAIVGRSGDGKGLACGVAARLVPDLLGAATAMPVSGEGLPSLFSAREPAEDDGDGRARHTVLRCVNARALLDVPEVTALGAAMGRSGSTLLPALTSAWSGEALGGQNVREDRRLKAVPFGYRLGLITGVQPGNADVLNREDITGLPQRILWATTQDPGAPAVRPDPPSGGFGFDPGRLKEYDPTQFDLNGLYQAGDYWAYRSDDGAPMYPLRYLAYPQSARDVVDADAVARLHGTRPDGMDAHSLFSALRTAGVLAIMEQRAGAELDVTEDDWARARYIAARSRDFREECADAGRRERRGKRRDAYADDILAKSEAQEIAAREKAECDYRRWSRRIENALAKHDPNREGLKGYLCQRHTGIPAADAYATIERMYEEGRLVRVGPTEERTGPQLWALADGDGDSPTPTADGLDQGAAS